MKNKLNSGYQGRILQVPRYNWRPFFKMKKIDAYVGWDIMVLDVTKTSVQISMQPKKDSKERVIIKITSVLVDYRKWIARCTVSTWCLKMERK